MKTIIAGSRSVVDYSLIILAVEKSGFDITEIVSGTAAGVDKLGEQYAAEHSIPVARFPADWKNKGRGAGHIRNAEMADYADALIAIWDGKSSGTRGMIKDAKRKGLTTYIVVDVPDGYIVIDGIVPNLTLTNRYVMEVSNEVLKGKFW